MKKKIIFVFPILLLKVNLVSILIFSHTFAQNSGKNYHPNPIIGQVDGDPVTFEDIRNKKIHDLSLQLYQHLTAQFVEYAVRKLAKNNPKITLTPEKKATPNEISQFYEQNNLKKRGSLKQLKPQIKNFLEEQILQQHFLNQYLLAIKNGSIISHLQTPANYFTKGNIKDSYLRGNKKASVILVEFSDYQCPFCARIQGTINKLIENYQDRVAFGYRHFPLSFHQEADEAAISSECAREQGKFEEMHTLLYSNQEAQTKIDLKKYARDIKIKSPKKFDNCLDSERYRGLVNQDIKDGAELGISGTPGFFLGLFNHNTGKIKGEILSGALPYNSFKQKIEKYLNQQQQ